MATVLWHQSLDRTVSGPHSGRWILTDSLHAAAMIAGRAAPACTQRAATNQIGDDGMHTNAHIESQCFAPAISAMYVPHTYNGWVRDRGA